MDIECHEHWNTLSDSQHSPTCPTLYKGYISLFVSSCYLTREDGQYRGHFWHTTKSLRRDVDQNYSWEKEIVNSTKLCRNLPALNEMTKD